MFVKEYNVKKVSRLLAEAAEVFSKQKSNYFSAFSENLLRSQSSSSLMKHLTGVRDDITVFADMVKSRDLTSFDRNQFREKIKAELEGEELFHLWKRFEDTLLP